MRPLLLALVVSACGSAPTVPDLVGPPAEGDAVVEGVVLSVDREAIAYDGNVVIRLETADGVRRVEIPARVNLCRASGLATAFEARRGDRLRVVGERSLDAVVPCTSARHSVHRLDGGD